MRNTISLSMTFAWMLSIFFVLTSCTSSDAAEVRSKKAIKKDIKSAEDKVMEASKTGVVTEEYTKASDELLSSLLEFYHSYPKDKYAGECVMKVHMRYSALGNTKLSVAYGDTLLDEFPKYQNRAQVIESQIQAYEMLVKPRNVAKIKSYLNLWLAENKKAPKQKIEDMQYHLKFVDMSLEDRMRMNMEELD